MQTLRESDRIPMSRQKYLGLDDTVRGEYVDGALVVSPTPTLPHQKIASNLWVIIRDALPADFTAACAWGWQSGDDEFVPDVMVFADTDDVARLTAPPLLAVEVLSTDRAADLVRKYAKYAAAGLERYWVVDPEGPEVIVYALSEGGVYVETGRLGPGTEARLDVGPTSVTFDPAHLLA